MHLSHDGPIVRGATITFNATVYYGNDIVTNDNLKYQWEDNGIPQHNKNVCIITYLFFFCEIHGF